ncbi:hypothetical protein QAD02_001021 [Eretmocerus hayati]|uniref:Uncharacterized protein n=1 Tax=Eretmocerus hayati TaxID=131215 RepID=A0ACC2NHN1_9HYME|nr:hypothetical protein QAD02_001021 [Eretmocerus hayati]
MEERVPVSNKTRNEDNNRLYIPQRWITIVTISFAILNGVSMRYCLAIALTKMVKQVDKKVKLADDDTCPDYYDNGPTFMKNPNETDQVVALFDWSEYTQGIILSSFYWTYFVSNIVGAIVIQRFGGKFTLACGMLTAAVFTLLTPASVEWAGPIGLIFARTFIGLGEGLAFPAANMVIAQWVPSNERSIAGAVMYAGSPFGIIFSMSISGIILQYSDSGWPVVFYFFGCAGMVSFLIICIFCYDKPSTSPFISHVEIEYLRDNLKNTHTNPPPTPWKNILTSSPVWALIIIMTGITWAFTIISTDMPKYMSGVLKFSSEDTGYFTSIPYVSMWIFTLIASFASDFLITTEKMSITHIRMIGITLSAMGPGIFIVLASYAGCNRLLFNIFLTICITLRGCTYCSIMVNVLDLTPNYAGTLMGLVNGVSTLAGILSPYLVGVFTPNQTLSEWRLIFWSVAIVCAVSTVIFLIFGSGDVQDWNDPSSSTKVNDNDEKNVRPEAHHQRGQEGVFKKPEVAYTVENPIGS